MTQIISARELSITELTAIVNAGFSGYLVPIEFNIDSIKAFISIHDIKLDRSWVAIQEKKPVGVAMIAERGNQRRLAMMAVEPNFRKSGIGRKLVIQVLSLAKQQLVSKVWLEVISNNLPAVRLYEQSGFKAIRDLSGFSGKLIGKSNVVLEEVSRAVFADAIRKWGIEDVPWQLSADTIEKLPPTLIGLKHNAAYVALTLEGNSRITINALIVDKEQRRKGNGGELMCALASRWPDAEIRVPAIYPSDCFEPFFESFGLTTQVLKQKQMVFCTR